MKNPILTVAIVGVAGAALFLIYLESQKAAANPSPTAAQQVGTWLGSIGSLGNDVSSLWNEIGGNGSSTGDSGDDSGFSDGDWFGDGGD